MERLAGENTLSIDNRGPQFLQRFVDAHRGDDDGRFFDEVATALVQFGSQDLHAFACRNDRTDLGKHDRSVRFNEGFEIERRHGP